MALVALICDPTTLLWPYWMWKELIWSRRLTKVHIGVALESYLNVLTNQNNFVWWYQTSLCVFKKKRERERSSKIDNQLFLGIFLYQRVWLYFFEGILNVTTRPKCLPSLPPFQNKRDLFPESANTAVVLVCCFFLFFSFLFFFCTAFWMCACVWKKKKSKISTMQHDRREKGKKKEKKKVNDQTT